MSLIHTVHGFAIPASSYYIEHFTDEWPGLRNGDYSRSLGSGQFAKISKYMVCSESNVQNGHDGKLARNLLSMKAIHLQLLCTYGYYTTSI